MKETKPDECNLCEGTHCEDSDVPGYRNCELELGKFNLQGTVQQCRDSVINRVRDQGGYGSIKSILTAGAVAFAVALGTLPVCEAIRNYQLQQIENKKKEDEPFKQSIEIGKQIKEALINRKPCQ